ncbi:MAG: hypothetical protein ACP5QK_07170 [Myxococcota bacterium]
MDKKSRFLMMYGNSRSNETRYVFYREKFLMLQYDGNGDLQMAGVVDKIGDKPDMYLFFLYGGHYVLYKSDSIFSLGGFYWKDGCASWGTVFEGEEGEIKRERIGLDDWIEQRLSLNFPGLLPG